MNVHKGDTVLVISGKDKGAKGKVSGGPSLTATRCSSRGRQPESRSTPPVSRTERGKPPPAAIVTQGSARSTSANVMLLRLRRQADPGDVPRRRREPAKKVSRRQGPMARTSRR